MISFTREDAARLIDKSEGEIIDTAKPFGIGHSHAHVGSADTPAFDFPSRRRTTTMYRSRTQAEKDLRDILNAHAGEIQAIPNGASRDFRGLVRLSRSVFEVVPVGAEYSYAGEKVTTTFKRQLYVKLYKDGSGALHLRTMYLKD